MMFFVLLKYLHTVIQIFIETVTFKQFFENRKVFKNFFSLLTLLNRFQIVYLSSGIFIIQIFIENSNKKLNFFVC